MKKSFFVLLLTTLAITSDVSSFAQGKVVWNSKNATAWFNKKEWLPESKGGTAVKYDAFGRIIEQADANPTGGNSIYVDLRKLKPHPSIKKVEFAKQYHGNTEAWKTAFSFLQTTDLAAIKPGRHAVDGENVYCLVTEGPARREDTTNWEGHVKYIDIHYVIRGHEKIQAAPISTAKIVKPYDPVRDIAFYTAKGKSYLADTSNFFIFFPDEAHRPNLQIDGNEIVKKIVVKVRVAPEQ